MEQVSDFCTNVVGMRAMCHNDVSHNAFQRISALSEISANAFRRHFVHSAEMLLKSGKHASQIEKVPNGDVKRKDSDNHQCDTRESDQVINLFKVHVYLSFESFQETLKPKLRPEPDLRLSDAWRLHPIGPGAPASSVLLRASSP